MSNSTPPARDDREPVDPYFSRQPPPAMTADGELVSNREMEAAAELMRAFKRVKLSSTRIDGFLIYRAYRWLSRIHPSS